MKGKQTNKFHQCENCRHGVAWGRYHLICMTTDEAYEKYRTKAIMPEDLKSLDAECDCGKYKFDYDMIEYIDLDDPHLHDILDLTDEEFEELKRFKLLE